MNPGSDNFLKTDPVKTGRVGCDEVIHFKQNKTTSFPCNPK